MSASFAIFWLGHVVAAQVAPPVSLSLEESTIEQAAAEFEAICLANSLDPDRTAVAIAASSLGYKAEPPGDTPQWRWNAPQAQATLSLPATDEQRGIGLPQCEVNMGTATPHMKGDLLTLIRPRLSTYVTTQITAHGEGGLSWPDASGTGHYRLDVAPYDRDGAPTQSSSFVLSYYTPEGERTLQQLLQKPSR